MRLRSIILTLLATALPSMPAMAQGISFNDETLDQFLKGVQAERTELDKVGDQLTQIDEKIANFRECSGLLKEAGGGKTGLAAKIAMKAKCGATSEDGFQKDRAKLLAQPEKIGAGIAGLKLRDYAEMKERVTGYLNGSRNFADGELKALAARADALSRALGVALAKASGNGGGAGRGAGNRLGNAISGAVAGQMQAFTAQMSWMFVQYLWGMLYMSGATMFETPYTPGQWTQWTIADGSKPEEKMILERAFLSRDADGSEWWRLKAITQSSESTDTIVMESLFKKLDPNGLAMQVVRMRGKFPGDTEGKEMMVPENMSTLSPNAFAYKPTKESLAGATVGTDPIKVGSATYLAKHVKFSAGTGNMEWWLSDKAPGGVVRTQFSGQDKDQKWSMDMTASGSGAKSELGVK